MMQDICVKKSAHLQYDDRQLIEKLYQLHHSQKEIAWVMHCSESKISRELKRGMVELRNGATWENYMTYSAQAAQSDADLKKTAKGAPLKIGHDYKLAKHIENKILKEHYSPYAIVKEIQDDGLHFETKLSISTIYNYVGSAVFLHVKPRHLLRMKKHKKESPQRQAYVNILRPCITARDVTRDVFGHWEMDTVIGQAKGKNNVWYCQALCANWFAASGKRP
ncbi:MAG: helix-turn-helix domain-containing protein, partial [Ruthenibacterium sp.]